MRPITHFDWFLAVDQLAAKALTSKMRMQFEVEDLEVASLGSPESQKVGEKSPNFLLGILNAGLSIIIGITNVINAPIIYAVVQVFASL